MVLPTVLRTMATAEIMSYYGPSTADTTILTLDSAEELAATIDRYHRVWVVIDHRSEPIVVERLTAWLDTQPHVYLAVDSDTSVVYMGQGASSQTLLREATDLAQTEVVAYASINQGNCVALK